MIRFEVGSLAAMPPAGQLPESRDRAGNEVPRLHGRVRYTPGNESAVIPPGESNPREMLRHLVLYVSALLEGLVVVDAKDIQV